MAVAQDYTGQKYGKLLVLKKISTNGKWLMRCDCGKEKIIRIHSVRQGVVKSCGCLHLERCHNGLNATKHGDARRGNVSRLHDIWRHMRGRCNREKDATYKHYGGRGLTVCAEWSDYKVFRDWAYKHGYADNLTIERKNNMCGYTPDNCCFTDMKTQQRNRRNNKLFKDNGELKCVAKIAEENKVKYNHAYYRLHKYGYL